MHIHATTMIQQSALTTAVEFAALSNWMMQIQLHVHLVELQLNFHERTVRACAEPYHIPFLVGLTTFMTNTW